MAHVPQWFGTALHRRAGPGKSRAARVRSGRRLRAARVDLSAGVVGGRRVRWTLPSGSVERLAEGVTSLFGSPGSGVVFHVSPFQTHAVVLAAFASVIAPFGGFFASGFKRAFKIKDFSDTIPGHGGITDRMDCQMVMAVFSHLYITNFVRRPGGGMSLGALLLHIELIGNDELVKLYKAVGRMLVARGLRAP